MMLHGNAVHKQASLSMMHKFSTVKRNVTGAQKSTMYDAVSVTQIDVEASKIDQCWLQ